MLAQSDSPPDTAAADWVTLAAEPPVTVIVPDVPLQLCCTSWLVGRIQATLGVDVVLKSRSVPDGTVPGAFVTVLPISEVIKSVPIVYSILTIPTFES